ncbi:MAG: 50S ribosomal protein L13 [Candidatus Marsarchaeota archaeon]|jgi:large subunit ribosomal protein L13|nr:50S ribosomal protein L13 [Candidatus Marsarchaeota archaeon]
MKDVNFTEYEVYDAKDKILGRLASVVAKCVLKGKNVVVINAEQSIISGNKKDIIEKYKVRLDLKERSNPEHSPYWSRKPDLFVKRVIRGMLPYHKKTSGKEAYKRLRVFIGTPEAFKDAKKIDIKIKEPKALYSNYMRVSELAKQLGYE